MPHVLLSLPPGACHQHLGDVASVMTGPQTRCFACWINSSKMANRSLDAIEAQPLPGTEGAESPFWSPDNQTVAFRAESKLKVTNADSGLVRTVCDLPDTLAGGSWSPGGDAIVFATPMHGLFLVPASGGSRRPFRILMPRPRTRVFSRRCCLMAATSFISARRHTRRGSARLTERIRPSDC